MAAVFENWMKPAEEHYPALPFIQEFENPPLFLSVSIGEYADFVGFSQQYIEPVVQQLADEMSAKMAASLSAMVGVTGGTDEGLDESHSQSSLTPSQEAQPSPA